MLSPFGDFMPVFVVSLTDILGFGLFFVVLFLLCLGMFYDWLKGRVENRARRKRLAAAMAVVDLKFKKSSGSITQGETWSDNSTGGRPGPGKP